MPGTRIAIRDEFGQDLPIGETGELCASGPQVMQGYWRQPEATAQVLGEDGFLRTGDLARRDEEGNYYILDRAKDMILVSGFNVYPNEIEETVSALPGVVECACVGAPDPKSGEAAVLFVVADPAALDEAAVLVTAAPILPGTRCRAAFSSCAKFPSPQWARSCVANCVTRLRPCLPGRFRPNRSGLPDPRRRCA
jgi:long-chain acyl-CoA synthetase